MAILLVIINDFHILRARSPLGPFETNPPLVVDTDAVLAFTVALKGFETIARQSGQILEER